MTARATRRWECAWAPALYAAVVLVLYREVWLGVDGRLRWFGWDCLEQYWPDLAYFARSVRAGDLPLWNPFDRGGFPFLADQDPGVTYPINWLLAGAGAVAGVPAWLMQAKALLHHALAGMLLHLFLRTRGLRPAAAAAGGVAWIVSVPMIVHKASAVEWPLVWTPLVLIAIDRTLARAGEPGRWRRAVLLGGAAWLPIAAGNPPGAFYALITATAYGAFRLPAAVRAAVRARGAARAAGDLAVALGVAAAVTAALAAITVVPARDVVALSARATRGLGYALSTALPAREMLAGLAFPPAGTVDAYMGALGAALALYAAIATPRRDGGAPLALVAFGALLLALAVGGATPLLPWLVEHVPGFGLFREPNRYKLPAALCVAAAAAYGVDAALAAAPAERRRRVVLLAIAVAAVAGAAVAVAALVTPHPGFARRAPAGLGTTLGALAAGGVALAAATGRRGRTSAALAAVAAGALYMDGARFGHWYVRVTEAPVDGPEDVRHVADLAGAIDPPAWRVYDEFVMEQRPGSRLGVRNFRGYPSLAPLTDTRYRRAVRRLAQSPELLEAFNVRWVLHGPHHRAGMRAHFLRQSPARAAPAHFRAVDRRRFEALHPVPWFAWYGGVRRVRDAARALDALVAAEEAGGVRRFAVVEEADVPAAIAAQLAALPAAPPPLVPGRVVEFRANRVVAEIDAPAAGVAVLNEKMFPGWRVEVDGRPAAGFRANYLSRAVVVGAGRHRVTWTYRPPGFAALASSFCAALIAVAAAAAATWRAARRGSAAARR